MRLLVPLALAAALVAGGAASAQTRGLAPYSAQQGDGSTVQTGRAASMPGPAAEPGAATARLGPYRGMRGHGRHASVRRCIRRADARGLHGRAKTRFIHYCEIGRR